MSPASPRPRIARPTTTPDPTPPPWPAAETLAADIGEVPAEFRPFHRSPVALRVDDGAAFRAGAFGVAGAEALLFVAVLDFASALGAAGLASVG